MKNKNTRSTYSDDNAATVATANCLDFITSLDNQSVQCIITSPPYNIGKSYEEKTELREYLEFQGKVIEACYRKLSVGGSICWQTGNYIDSGSITPLDVVLFPIFNDFGDLCLRNRIVWHYNHGQHSKSRFSGRYETILWFTKGSSYEFNLDAVRVPQKYPQKKSFRGPNRGKFSCNPLGKNPSDVWQIPNVTGNHVEKTMHPCQFPVALAETLVLALTNPGDLVFDPFMGSGSTGVASVANDRRFAGCDLISDYVRVARSRIKRAFSGKEPFRPRLKPIQQNPSCNVQKSA